VVVKVATVADPENDIHVFTNIRRAAADVAGRNLQSETRSTTVDGLRVYVSNGSGANYSVIQSSNNVFDTDNPVVYTELCDPNNGTAANRIYSYFGTGSAIQTNTQTAAVSTANPTNSMGIGATDQATQGITGYIAEIVIMKSPYNTETDRVALRDYLKDKWGL